MDSVKSALGFNVKADEDEQSLATAGLPTGAEFVALKVRLAAQGQGHLLTFWDDLAPQQKASLWREVTTLDLERVERIYQQATTTSSDGSEASAKRDHLEALPSHVVDSTSSEHVSDWRQRGLSAIEQGKVAVILMAGGQGTRLGSLAPKGCYDIGLPSRKSLFQLQAERILRLQKLAKGGPIPWVIMTSEATDSTTKSYFDELHYFGLDKRNIIFFKQGTLPCLTFEGKIFLESKFAMAVAPDGNGGMYNALARPDQNGKSVLDQLEERGVRYIHAYGVDNCLVKVADPVFVGYMILKDAECGAKTVVKTDPDEAVGVVCKRNGSFSVVEYSEIGAKLACERSDDGQLRYRSGNIANHFYTLEFLRKVKSIEDKMSFHIARKKIKHLDIPSGNIMTPKEANGMKLELFVFDVFPWTEKFAVLEVDRQNEFSPLKNAPGTGVDDPETSKRDILAQNARFLQAAGAIIKSGVVIELSPLVSYDGEGLESLKGKTFSSNRLIQSLDDIEDLK